MPANVAEATNGAWDDDGCRFTTLGAWTFVIICTVVICAAVAGCRREAQREQTSLVLESVVVGATEALASGARPSPESQLTAGQARDLALGLLTQWVRAQNMKDKDAYRVLYHPSEFKGIKRVHNGKLQHFDHAAWMKDRMAMFDAPFEVSTEQHTAQTWLDPGSKLPEGVTRVSFVQRWKSGKYADHGPKTLLVWRDSNFGFQFIVFEEMLESQAGWADGTTSARTEPSASSSSPATITVDFSRPLSALGMDFQTASALGTKALQSPHLAVFTRALLAVGPLNCMAYVGYERCGETQEEWSSVQSTNFEHACTRRAALLPILLSGKLPLDDLRALQPKLLDIVRQDEPDPELVTALARSLAALPREELFPFVEASVRTRRANAAFARMYELLAPEQALSLASKYSSPDIITHLDPTAHAAGLARVHPAARLPRDTLIAVVAALTKTNNTNALRFLAVDEDCQVAMLAANALSTLGEAKYLPTWVNAKVDTADVTLCRLSHDPNVQRRDAEISRFLNPNQPARLFELHVEVPLRAESEEHERTIAPSKEQLARIARVEAALGPQPGLVQQATERALGADDLLTIRMAAGIGPDAYYDRAALHFVEIDGHPYLESIAAVFVTDHECPC